MRYSYVPRRPVFWEYRSRLVRPASADPTQNPVFLGDVVLTGTDARDRGDVPDSVVRDVFDDREFIVQVSPHGDEHWYDTYARFSSIFDAATWCLLFGLTMRPGPEFRLQSRALEPNATDDIVIGGESSG